MDPVHEEAHMSGLDWVLWAIPLIFAFLAWKAWPRSD